MGGPKGNIKKKPQRIASTIEVNTEKVIDLFTDRQSFGPGNLPDIDMPRQEVKKDSKRTKALKKAKAQIQENMPPVYALGQEIIESSAYKQGEDGEEEALNDSPEMEDIKLKIEMVQSFLSNPMPPFAVKKKDEERYREELKNSSLAASLMYNKLAASLDEWLMKKDALTDYSEERFEMISRLKEQILDEEARFEQSLLDYREMMTGSREAKAGKEATWADMLRHERAEKIDLDAEKIKTKDEGNGTSKVLKFKRNGKTYFFKAEENIDTGSFDDIMAAAADKSELPKAIFDGYKKAVNELDSTSKGNNDTYLKIVEVFDYCRSDACDYIKKDASPLHKFVKELSKAQRKQFSLFFVDAFKTYNLKRVAELGAKIQPGRNISRRNVATSRLAKLLGIEELIAESRTVVIKHNGKRVRGNIMDKAEGGDDYAVKEENAMYTDEVEDQLICLQFFDLICGQTDRNYGNFLLETNGASAFGGNNMIKKIKAIDNDLAFGNLSFQAAAKGQVRLRPLRSDMIKLIPPKFKKAILALDPGFAKLILRDLLKADELDYLEERLRGLQAFIRKTDASDEEDIKKKIEQGENEAELRDRKLNRLKFIRKVLGEPAKNPADRHRKQSAAGMEEATLFSGFFTYTPRGYENLIRARKEEIEKEAKKGKKK